MTALIPSRREALAMRSSLRLLAVCGLLSPVLSAQAYEYDRCSGDNSIWRDSTQFFFASPVSFPPGSSAGSAVNAALAGWNAFSPGSNFYFALFFTSPNGTGLGNDYNDVLFTNDYDFGNALAVTRSRTDPCFWPWKEKILETDVLFNNAYVWSHDTQPAPPVSGSPYNTALVGVHEFGHAMGLKHENDVLATMNSYYPSGGVLGNANQVHPHSDDVLGARDGYGTSGAPRDLAVSAFNRTAPGSADVIASRWMTYRGIPQGFDFTLENRGTQYEGSVKVNFYLSTDRWISTSDTYLGSASFGLAAGAVGTYQASVTVPTSLSPGWYYFGYVIDPDNTVGETNEDNNAVGHVSTTYVTAATPPNQAPSACFSTSAYDGPSPLYVSFNASCSSDVDGTIVSYTWDLGDGFTYSGPSADHWYSPPNGGWYNVQLTVTDDDGASSTSTSYINVYPPCPPGQICPIY